MKFDTLTGRWSLIDMYLFTGLLWFINPIIAPKVLALVVGITIGTLLVDVCIFIFEIIKDTIENRKRK